MSFTNSGTIVLCRTDYRVQPSSFQAAARALCLIRMLCFSVHAPVLTIHVCSVTKQLQHMLNVWCLTHRASHSQSEHLHSSKSFPWSHHWSWLDQRTGLSHRAPAASTPCAHNSLSHTGISGPVQGCVYSWADPWPHTSQCSINLQHFWFFKIFFLVFLPRISQITTAVYTDHIVIYVVSSEVLMQTEKEVLILIPY